jgi:hypothetical protein
MHKSSILFITDLYYKANNRTYYTEDIFLTGELKESFNVTICHPLHTEPFEAHAELVMMRNSGPVIYYKHAFDAFVARVTSQKINTYNTFDGRGDMKGKDYLLQLTQVGFPVIPTINTLADIGLLPANSKYVIKPLEGADSIGLKTVEHDALPNIKLENEIVQPYIDFEYEVSFYFIDSVFQYALYAPDKTKRWNLENYKPTEEDLAFSQRFVDWNTMSRGIQRIDACRTKEGNLLLVEIEDLNPYLSLDLLDDATRKKFVENLILSLKKAIG